MESQELKEDGGYSGFAIAGFVCGILGLLLVLSTGWPFLLGTLGTIFSSIGLSQTLNGRKGKGFAIAGLVAGILAIFIFWRLVFFLAGLATII